MAGIVVAGSLLGCGRQDWFTDHDLAFRAWALSWFFFFLLVSGLYAAGRAFSFASHPGFWPALAALSALLNLPYRWLGLDRWRYLASHPWTYQVPDVFVPEWLTLRTFLAPRWNSTDSLFGALILGAVLAGVMMRRRQLSEPGTTPALTRRPLFFAGLFILLALEAWLHSSDRSPYSYVPHFDKPPAQGYTYTVALLPDDRGLVNRDAPGFIRLEELFLGPRTDTPTYLIHRPFPFYLGAHLGYFAGSYHAFLVLNLLLWWAAAVSLCCLCQSLSGSPLVGGCAAFLLGCSPGFIMYAAQPMTYLAGFALLIIALNLHHQAIRATGLRSWPALYATGITFALTMLTFDVFAWCLFFVGYALLCRVSLWRAVFPIVLGAGIYAAFLALVFHVFYFPRDDLNTRQIAAAWAVVKPSLLQPNAHNLYSLWIGSVRNYWSQVCQVMFFVPVALAVGGFCLPALSLRLRLVCLLLLLPSYAGFVFLYFGHSFLSLLSRLNYPAFPAILFLAAFLLARAYLFLSARGRVWAARLALGLPLAVCLVIANLDAFGLLPQLYYHFYWSSGGHFD